MCGGSKETYVEELLRVEVVQVESLRLCTSRAFICSSKLDATAPRSREPNKLEDGPGNTDHVAQPSPDLYSSTTCQPMMLCATGRIAPALRQRQ